jgi:integrase/recombinase XerD
MREGYVAPFKMQAIKVDKTNVETYSDDELRTLLQKPNIKKCSFIEYQSWVMTNFLFSTGVRQRSLMNIKVKELDFDNNVVYVNVTKNRKPLIVPINRTMINILNEFLKYRKPKSKDDFLFCNVFGEQLVKSTCYHMLYGYNKRRGVETTGIHRYRHTFARQWILNGGNVVSLSRLLGHSSLQITQNYINLLVSDVAKDVDTINLLDKFSNKKKIQM